MKLSPRGDYQERKCYLLTDRFIYAKGSDSFLSQCQVKNSKKRQYRFRGSTNLDTCYVNALSNSKNGFEIVRIDTGRAYVLQTKTEEERNTWVETINQCIGALIRKQAKDANPPLPVVVQPKEPQDVIKQLQDEVEKLKRRLLEESKKKNALENHLESLRKEMDVKLEQSQLERNQLRSDIKKLENNFNVLKMLIVQSSNASPPPVRPSSPTKTPVMRVTSLDSLMPLTTEEGITPLDKDRDLVSVALSKEPPPPLPMKSSEKKIKEKEDKKKEKEDKKKEKERVKELKGKKSSRRVFKSIYGLKPKLDHPEPISPHLRLSAQIPEEYQRSSEEGLPPNWERHISSDGHTYYSHRITGESRWELPGAPSEALDLRQEQKFTFSKPSQTASQSGRRSFLMGAQKERTASSGSLSDGKSEEASKESSNQVSKVDEMSKVDKVSKEVSDETPSESPSETSSEMPNETSKETPKRTESMREIALKKAPPPPPGETFSPAVPSAVSFADATQPTRDLEESPSPDLHEEYQRKEEPLATQTSMDSLSSQTSVDSLSSQESEGDQKTGQKPVESGWSFAPRRPRGIREEGGFGTVTRADTTGLRIKFEEIAKSQYRK